jgi:putative transposase
MSRLSHRTAPSCTYFVTTKTWQSRAIFQVAETAEVLVECLMKYRDQVAYLLHEFVIMPNHLHLLLTPSETTSLAKAMQLIKGGSSFEIHKRRRSNMEIWQPGFHEWTIRDSGDFESKRLYIRQNPVEVHLVERSEDWPYSSASGNFILDPVEIKGVASGAEAHTASEPGMSELKLRPPKKPTDLQLRRPGRAS